MQIATGPQQEAEISPASYRPRNLLFLVSLAAILCGWFALARAGLMLRNAALLSGLSTSDIIKPFIVGLRFDLATACYLLLPFTVLAYLPFLSLDRSARMRRWFYWTFLAVLGVCSYLLLAEYEFFHEFQVRFNQVFVAYLDQPATVGGMIWNGYPVARYTAAWLIAMLAMALVLRWLMRRMFGGPDAPVTPLKARYIVGESLCIIIAATGLVFGLRGGFQSTPLRWGDAFKSDNDVVNQLSLNGLYTLGRTVSDNVFRHDASDEWAARLGTEAATALAREMVVSESDRLLDAADSTVLRRAGEEHRTVSLKPGISRPNVVLVLMESFSAQLSAACGAEEDVASNFTQIARQGVLFDRSFSIGTHTHQGIFGSLLSFPNLPGYEALMQTQLANQHFSSLPGILREEGYHTMFLYNGNLSWDNMRGFFRKQGIEQFVGGDDFPTSIRRDAVWGVDDADLLHRANAEFEVAGSKGPFLGVVLTLSNHSPWDLPDFPGRITDRGDLNGPLNGVKYADWAIGEFMAEARKMEYFENTLFVFVGDHGSRVVGEKLTAASLLTHHVPLLFYGPGVLNAAPGVDHTVASQLNIVPTILGLLDVHAPHASWGRDLFTTEGRAENVAVFKGSGGDNSMAIVDDDLVYVVDEADHAMLYRYTLAPHARVTPVSDDTTGMGRKLEQRMEAFLQCAIHDLREMNAGPEHGGQTPLVIRLPNAPAHITP